MTHNVEAIFDAVTDRYEPEDDGKPLQKFPVDNPQATGRPIDAIINNPTFMTQASTGQPVPERDTQDRAIGRERISKRRMEEQAAMNVQLIRIANTQSRGNLWWDEVERPRKPDNDNTNTLEAAA